MVTRGAGVWWVNCEHPRSFCDGSATGLIGAMAHANAVGGFVPAADGTLLVALADGLYDFEPKNGHMSLRVSSPFPEHVKLHECQCDRQGRFWSGYDHLFPMTILGRAYYCRLDGDRLRPSSRVSMRQRPTPSALTGEGSILRASLRAK